MVTVETPNSALSASTFTASDLRARSTILSLRLSGLLPWSCISPVFRLERHFFPIESVGVNSHRVKQDAVGVNTERAERTERGTGRAHGARRRRCRKGHHSPKRPRCGRRPAHPLRICRQWPERFCPRPGDTPPSGWPQAKAPGVASPIICRSALAIEAHRGVASLANTARYGQALRLALRSDGCAQPATSDR